jgi:hypothetical protein
MFVVFNTQKCSIQNVYISLSFLHIMWEAKYKFYVVPYYFSLLESDFHESYIILKSVNTKHFSALH